MNIPDKAVEAVVDATNGQYLSDHVREILEIAAPYIEAAAIRREAQDVHDFEDRAYLLRRADDLDPE